MNYLEEFIAYAEIPKTALAEHIPEFILELLKRGITAYADAWKLKQTSHTWLQGFLLHLRISTVFIRELLLIGKLLINEI